jgi:hypothetical protein
MANDTASQRRAHERAKRPTRPSVCNGVLGNGRHNSARVLAFVDLWIVEEHQLNEGAECRGDRHEAPETAHDEERKSRRCLRKVSREGPRPMEMISHDHCTLKLDIERRSCLP